jgi:HEAT repeat protein
MKQFIPFFGHSLPESLLTRALGFWGIKTLFHAGSILGITLLLGYFIAYYDIPKLPLLFLGIAIGTLFGTLVTQILIKWISTISILIFWTILIFSSLIYIYFLEHSHFLLFFITIGSVFSVGMNQLNILLSIIIEKSFSPLESEEAFPLIESAEPMGGMLAGIIAFFVTSFVEPKFLIVVWSLLILFSFLGLIIFRYKNFHNEVYFEKKVTNKKKWMSSWSLISQNKLLYILFWFVFLQSFCFLFVEFLYSISLSSIFSHHNTSTEDVLVTELTHGIGFFHLSIYLILLILQIALASKIQKQLGIVKTLFLQPVFIFFNTLISLLTGSLVFGLIGKGGFEIVGGLSKNAYHSSFYAFYPSIREESKEFLEGVSKPLGIIFATLIIIIISSLTYIFKVDFIYFYIFCALILFLVITIILFLFRYVQHGYTQLAINNLVNNSLLEEKIDAIEILSQKGHKDTINILSQVLTDKKTSIFVQKKIIKAFGLIDSNEVIPDLFWGLTHPNEEIKIKSINALSKNTSLMKYDMNKIFSYHKLISSLKKIFLNARSKKLHLEVIKIFKKIKHPSVASFLIDSLKSNNSNIKYSAILGCQFFHDISIAFYISPLLKDKDLFIRSASIIALWEFTRYRKKSFIILKEMIESSDENILVSAIYTIGELNIDDFIFVIKDILKKNNNIEIKKHSLVSLIKMGHYNYIPDLLEMLFSNDENLSKNIYKIMFSSVFNHSVHYEFTNKIKHKAMKEIYKILNANKYIDFKYLSKSILKRLIILYNHIGEDKAVYKIKNILNKS